LLTNVEKGLFFTIRELTIRPGKVITDYLSGATVRYYNPLRYIVVLAGLSAFASTFIDFVSIIESSSQGWQSSLSLEAKALQAKIIKWTLNYLSIFYLAMLPLNSLASYLVFRKRQYVYAEHLVANAFIYGHLALFSLIILPLYQLNAGLFVVGAINTLTVFAYNACFFNTWFKTGWIKAILKTALVLLISYLLIGLLAAMIGIVIEALQPTTMK
jgi:hypothetical protein